VHLRRQQRRHADVPHQGVDRGRATTVGHSPRISESQGYSSDGIWFVSLSSAAWPCTLYELSGGPRSFNFHFAESSTETDRNDIAIQ